MSATLDRFPGWWLGLRPADGGGALLGCWRAQNKRTGRSYDL